MKRIQKTTSKHRMLAAMKCETVDHTPCSIYFNEHLQVRGYDLLKWRDHVRLQADLGTDPIAYLIIPNSYHPEVETRVWVDDSYGERGSVLFKEYRTPAGALRIGAKRTSDWPPHHEGIPGFNWDLLRHAADYSPDWHKVPDVPWDDHTASNIVEPLVKSPEDVEAFEYIWRPPEEADFPAMTEYNEAVRRVAEEYGIPVQGYAGAGLATLMFTMGAENMALFSVDHPESFKRLAEIDHRTNLRRIELCARQGADYVKRFGGYEQSNFFHPRVFREVVSPLLRREVEAAHDAGILIYYRIVTGMEPNLEEIASLGFDCIQGGEPHLSNCSFEMWREAFSGRASSWTGVSTPALLVGKDPDTVRREVRRCIDVFGSRGFILGVTNSIRADCRWENVLAMVDEWKKLR